ncbi:MAG: hypothetical protein RIR26_1228 [Pseudomonadota bacterium]|jgi:predicted Zn-dependent protease
MSFNKLCRIYLVITLQMLVAGCASMRHSIFEYAEESGNDTLMRATAHLTPRQEHFLGRSILARVVTDRNPVPSERLQLYVNKIGQYLSLHSQRPTTYNGYRFVVIDDPAQTALSMPGGFVAISSGMLRTVENEDELAAVLAHEIAHIAARHAEKNIKTENRLALGQKILTAISQMVPDRKALEIFGEAVVTGLEVPFNKIQEREADADAVSILHSAGYDPKALMRVIERIPKTATLFSKHSRNESRLSALEKQTSGYSNTISKQGLVRFRTEMNPPQG